jgi:phenylalanine-4-hydroxylase
MILKHIKSDVYHLIAGDYLDIFLNEQELRQLIGYNDIADIIKTPIGWYVNHDLGFIPFSHYLKHISQNALNSLAIIILNNKTNVYESSIN